MSALYAELVDAKKHIGQELQGRYLRVTTGIADNFPLAADMPSWIFLKATTVRDVLMPAVTADIDGKLMWIYNEGTGTITLKTSSDAALAPAVTLTGVAGGGGNPAIMQALFGIGAAGVLWKKWSGS